MSGLLSNLYSDRVYGRVHRSSGRHSSTRDHLVSEGLLELGGGERVVLALGLGSGSIDNRDPRYCKGLNRGANCVWSCSLCPRCQHDMTAVVLSCTRAPLVSAHCSLSPDDVFVCWVGLGSAVSADWLSSCAPAACVSVAVEPSVTCTCTKVK